MAYVNTLTYAVCLLSSLAPIGTHVRLKGQEDIIESSCSEQPHLSTCLQPDTYSLEETNMMETVEVTHPVNMFVEPVGAKSLSHNSKESSSVFCATDSCGDGGGGSEVGKGGGGSDTGDGGGGSDAGDGGGGSEASEGGVSVGYQLVPYKPSPVLSVFHEVERSFTFGGLEWSIYQQWNDVGLASVVWEAALLLCQYLEALPPSALLGKRVIELGAGTGLVGFVASSLGAKSVVLTDKNTGPAHANLKANRHNLVNRDISVAQFDWGTDPSSLEPPFDVVLAADVIYVEETYPLLLKSLLELSNKDTVILISCNRRYERDDRFFDLLQESGRFSYSVVWVWPKNEDSTQPENDVKVYRVRLVA